MIIRGPQLQCIDWESTCINTKLMHIQSRVQLYIVCKSLGCISYKRDVTKCIQEKTQCRTMTHTKDYERKENNNIWRTNWHEINSHLATNSLGKKFLNRRSIRRHDNYINLNVRVVNENVFLVTEVRCGLNQAWSILPALELLPLNSCVNSRCWQNGSN